MSNDAMPARLQLVLERVAAACASARREPNSVTLIGASKTVPAAELLPFVEGGLLQLGENYVQEALAKQRELGQLSALPVEWHLVGALQSNKAREAVASFAIIHAVDRPSLARELAREAERAGKTQRVLLQVNLGEESSKSGVLPAKLPALFEFCQGLPALRVEGLMSLPPYREDPEAMRPYHRELRLLRDELRRRYGLSQDQFATLSMGMSNDFEVAIAEGATHIRVGTALFGARS